MPQPETWRPLQDWHRLEKSSGIYVIRCTLSGKEYVGKSVEVRNRLRVHASATKSQRLHQAIRKHGLENFVMCVLSAGASIEQLCQLEIETIEARKTYGAGYNDTRGGDGGWEGKRHAPESITRMKTGKLASNPMTGRTQSGAAREKIRAGNLGKKRSAATLKNMQQAALARPRPGHLDEFRMRPVLVWPPGAMVPLEFGSHAEAADWAGTSRNTIMSWIGRDDFSLERRWGKRPASLYPWATP